MTPEQWARIREIFGAALELPPQERDAYVDRATQGDESIRIQVKALLAASDKELSSPVAGVMSTASLSPLCDGNVVGRYRIERHIGAGGMGEVYRAFDPELARAVALKLLRSSLAGDAAMRSRFMREARAASSLSHPNVVRIYDVGEDGGQAFIAMEYIEGRPLDQMISAGGMPVLQALEYAGGIAAGLADAHSRGIVHRDLKPSNIMITPNGEVKLLDFGLAKRVEFAGGSEAGLTMRGEILGTPAYMSPEQAQGKEVDGRSDIFSFGSVLYEMLSGRRAFTGDSAVSLLGAIVREDPPPLKWLSPELQKLLKRCLQKDRNQRLQHMGDVRLMLEEARESLLAPGRRVPLRVLAAAAAILTASVAIALLISRSGQESRNALRFTPFAVDGASTSMPAWSPDGKSIAYLGDVNGIDQVFVRNLGAPAAAVVTRSARDCGPPFWSTDGTRVFYGQGGDLWSVGLAGGEPRLELRDAHDAARSPDGKTLAFLRGAMGKEGLWLKSEADPAPRQYRREPFPVEFVAGYVPKFSADGSSLGIVVDRETGGGTGEFWVLPLGDGEPRRVPASLTASAWLQYSWWTDPETVLMARSDPGHLHLELMDLETGAIRQLTTGTGQESEPTLSPDGRTVAFTAGRTDMDLFEVPLDGSSFHPLLATALDEQSGAWLPSGAEYAYITNRSGTPEVWLRRSLEFWTKPILANNADGVPSWYLLYCLRASPDGQHVSYDVLGNRHWIWISALSGGRPVPLDTESTDQHAASWSPDGKRLAYRRLRGGRFELATIGFGDGAPLSLGETGEGGHMRGGVTDWSPTGEWICHNGPSGLELVSPDGKQRRLLSRSHFPVFVFSGDGKTVIALRRSERRHWQLVELPVTGGPEQRVVELPAPPGLSLHDMTRHPDGKRLLVTVATARHGVWLMEGFSEPRPWWRHLIPN